MVLVCGKERDTTTYPDTEKENKVCIEVDAKDLAKLVFKIMNSDDRGFTDAIKEELRYEHRTLQQNYVRSMANVLTAYCDDDRGFDARNENSKVFACKVKDVLLKENINFPLI